jgi:hypothetical protein
MFFIQSLGPAISQAKRNGCGKQIAAIEKKMHTDPSRRNNHHHHHHQPAPQQPQPQPPAMKALPQPNHHFGRHYQLPPLTNLQVPDHYSTHFNSAATTPPLTTGTESLQSSRIPSVNGDTLEGAAVFTPSNTGSDKSTDTYIPRGL